MKYFILTMVLVATVLSAEVAVAQIQIDHLLFTPNSAVGLPPAAKVPLIEVPAAPQAFLH